MTRLALEHQAINLAQGFPDFDGPCEIFDFARRAMDQGCNQYARSMGLPVLVESVVRHLSRAYGMAYEPMSEVCVTTGATEGLAASVLGLINPGDEVLLMEPFYDSYPALAAMAGASVKSIVLESPGFELDLDKLAALISPKTRLLILNNPHNPSGKVFTSEELQGIAKLCIAHDIIVISDEVYEFLTYEGIPHIPIAGLPGMRERTLTVSSTGKTFSLTGWKIGWVFGPEDLISATQAAHQFLTFAVSTPFQAAMAKAIDHFGSNYLVDLRKDYLERRDFLVDLLKDKGFGVSAPKGSYFVLADIRALTQKPAADFAMDLIRERQVAALPVESFYLEGKNNEGRKLLRFAFCKRMETLREAKKRL
jgi:N-succinyldiaminopimelate aminotransferase